jgi:3-deoxy-manno-octulosonate cytidylyltransferase (CMP-KDO synthetase)
MKTLIIIPARYRSTRLPGKPLALIAGKTMLQRVVEIARAAAQAKPGTEVVVATDDDRISRHCDDLGVKWAMTDPSCPTGTDRAAQAVDRLASDADLVINLQGDAPLVPPDFVTAMIDAYERQPCDLVTPVTQLTWAQLDKLRENKKTTPFSGTTAVFDKETGKAHWFSKTILPAMRKEDKLRAEGPVSPVYRHIGLYGYARSMLKTFVSMPESPYENMEGLEQLRVLENGYTIRCVPVDYRGRASMSGVDSPEDIVRAEELIAKHGELLG